MGGAERECTGEMLESAAITQARAEGAPAYVYCTVLYVTARRSSNANTENQRESRNAVRPRVRVSPAETPFSLREKWASKGDQHSAQVGGGRYANTPGRQSTGSASLVTGHELCTRTRGGSSSGGSARRPIRRNIEN